MDADGPVAIRDFCPFRLVVDEDLEQLDREVTTSVAAVGTTLFEEGDPADGIAAIVEGSVEVVTGGRVIATPGPGALLGELPVFLPRASRTATARASSPVRMVTWRAADLRTRLVRHDRRAGGGPLRYAARRAPSRCSSARA